MKNRTTQNWLMHLNKLVLLVICIAASLPNGKAEEINHKFRLVVLADMGNEPDEEQQMLHLLMYNNEIDLEGLIAVSGIYLRPDHALKFKQRLYPDLFYKLIDGYSQVYANLQAHAEGWKSPEYLRSIVKTGQRKYGLADVGEGKTSEGSQYILDVLLKNDPRPVYFAVNAGSNTLAQALWDYRNTHSKEQVDALISKIIVYENGAQDDAGGWIANQFPAIHWMRASSVQKAYGTNDKDLGPWTWKPYEYSEEGQHEWAKEHIQTQHGPLGDMYPDRIFRDKVYFIEGGGTIPWIGLIAPALYDPMHQNWGGFSGRFTDTKVPDYWSPIKAVRETEAEYGRFSVYADTSDAWVNAADGKTYNNKYTPALRWRQLLFDDFKCRMDWCIEPFENANHNPVAVVNSNKIREILYLSAQSGEKLTLDASDSYDPDKNQKLSFLWSVYPEAGTYKSDIKLSKSDQNKLTFKVPKDAKGKQIHLLLDVSDDSEIGLMHDVRRIVIQVN